MYPSFALFLKVTKNPARDPNLRYKASRRRAADKNCFSVKTVLEYENIYETSPFFLSLANKL